MTLPGTSYTGSVVASSWDFIHWIGGCLFGGLHALDRWFLGTVKGISVNSVWCVQRCVIPGGIISSGEVCEGDEQ